jgi:3-oxoacyl-[acyl-carrier protein] reductase
MDLGINGRVAMVAAASKGLGLACATSLLKEGCAVSICGRDESALEKAIATLRSVAPGGKVLAMSCDVSKPGDLERWHSETLLKLGEVDILITNTGGPPAAKFMELSETQWQSGVDSTLMNVVRMVKLVAPSMQKKKWGRIVHITSLVAKQPMDLLTISSTLRAGLSALTKTMANQFAPDNVLVNALLPGHVMTDRQLHLQDVRAEREGRSRDEVMAEFEQSIPLKRMGKPQEIGDVVAFLCSERASYLTGVSLQVDGGSVQSIF